MEADFQARLHDILRTRSGLGSQLLRTPTPRCSGPREPGVAAASTARRGRFERPRRALAPRLPPPPELRGACGRAAHAHRDGVRAAACRASPRSRARAPPEFAGGRAGEGLISAADAMSDSMGKAVWQAAKDGNEAELRRLIERGGSVNWRGVRRRMCLAWAPASSTPLSSVAPAAPAGHGAIFPTAQLHGARRTPACSPIRLTPLALEDGSCVRPGLRIHTSECGSSEREQERRVRPTPHRVRGERERHERKSGEPSPKHTPWVRFHGVISFVSSLLSLGRRMDSFA
jgi:hypothetical protein